MARDLAERREPPDARPDGKRLLRQHQGISGASRALFHDGRQPRQLHRQPRGKRGRLCAGGEPDRLRAGNLLVDGRRRTRPNRPYRDEGAIDSKATLALARHGKMPYKGSRGSCMPSAHRKPISPKREYKTERLELRLAPSAKKLIQQAMSVTGLAAGDL